MGQTPQQQSLICVQVIYNVNMLTCVSSYVGLNTASSCSLLVFCSQGDSGGPLLYNGTVVGITSYGGKKCGQIRKPGIYTIVSHYTEWIDNTMALQQPDAAPDQSS